MCLSGFGRVSSRRTVSRDPGPAVVCFQRLRQESASKRILLSGESETDERCCGGVRKGRRERWAAGNVPVSRLFTRGGRTPTPSP